MPRIPGRVSMSDVERRVRCIDHPGRSGTAKRSSVLELNPSPDQRKGRTQVGRLGNDTRYPDSRDSRREPPRRAIARRPRQPRRHATSLEAKRRGSSRCKPGARRGGVSERTPLVGRFPIIEQAAREINERHGSEVVPILCELAKNTPPPWNWRTKSPLTKEWRDIADAGCRRAHIEESSRRIGGLHPFRRG